jgi:hypothetical protein
MFMKADSANPPPGHAFARSLSFRLLLFVIQLVLTLASQLDCVAVDTGGTNKLQLQQPWATAGLVQALGIPELQESVLRVADETPFFFDSKDHQLQEAMRLAIARLAEGPGGGNNKLLLSLVRRFDVGIPNLSAWLHRVVTNTADLALIQDAYKMLAERQVISGPDREVIRKRLLERKKPFMLVTDLAKHCQFLQSIGALLPEDKVMLREQFQHANQTGDKLMALATLSQIDQLTDAEMRILRDVMDSKVFGEWDKRSAFKIIANSGRATADDALNMWILMISEVPLLAVEEVVQKILTVEGAKAKLRQAILIGAPTKDSELRAQMLYHLADFKLIEPSEIGEAETRLASNDPDIFKLSLSTLVVGGVLAERHTPVLLSLIHI